MHTHNLHVLSGTSVRCCIGARRMFCDTLTRRWHFSARTDVLAAIVKIWRQIENPTPSIDANLLEEQSCQISSRFDWKRHRLKLFWRGRPNKNKKKNNWKNTKMSSDMRSVFDLKNSYTTRWYREWKRREPSAGFHDYCVIDCWTLNSVPCQ